MARNVALERTLDVFFELMSGYPIRLVDLEHLGIHPRTLRRDLCTLVNVKKAKIRRFKRDKETVFICDFYNKFYEIKGKKRCRGCLVPKTLDEFANNRFMTDGKQIECRDCQIDSARRYKQKHKERVNTLQRKYYRKFRTKRKEEARNYYYENRDKILAQKKKKYHALVNRNKLTMTSNLSSFN